MNKNPFEEIKRALDGAEIKVKTVNKILTGLKKRRLSKKEREELDKLQEKIDKRLEELLDQF